MKLLKHIRLAGIFGILTGSIIGLVDILSKIIALSFEWFELYIVLLTSILVISAIFIVVSLLVELIKRIFKLKVNIKDYYLFYLVSSIAALLSFYGFVFVHLFILTTQDFTHPLSITLSIVVLLISSLPYIIFLSMFKNKKLIVSSVQFFRSNMAKKIFINIIFLIAVFLIFSFTTDIFILNYDRSYLSEESVDQNPNILLILIDSVRADHLSLYNYHLNTTPNLDKFAEKSVVFENAISPSSWTLPTVASILTGKYSHNSHANFKTQMVYRNQTLLPEILRDKGYVTASITGAPFTKVKYGLGQGYMTIKDRLDFFEYVHSYDKVSLKRVLHGFFPNIDKFIFRADDEKPAQELNKDIFKWLDLHKDQTFFLYLDYLDPHPPYNLGTEFKSRFTDKDVKYKEVQNVLDKKRNEDVSKETIDYINKIYDTELFYLDYHLGELFNKLGELEIDDKTIVVIVADHGTELYDHGDFESGRTLYQEAIHVPLIIYYPKELTPQRVKEQVSTIDIFSTILDLADINSPDDIDSVSLVPLIKNTGPYNRDVIFSQIFGSWDKPNDIAYQRVVIKGDWKLIEVAPAQPTLHSSLFNLKKDPEENRNLYSTNIARRKLMQNYLADIVNGK